MSTESIIHGIALVATLAGLGVGYLGIAGKNKRRTFIGVGIALLGALVRTSLELSKVGIIAAVIVYSIALLILAYAYRHI